MARVAGKALVVRTRMVLGSRGVVIFSDKVAEMASTNQFFNFILECFTFLYGMTVVSVIAAIFSHVRVWGSSYFAWWWDEIGL